MWLLTSLLVVSLAAVLSAEELPERALDKGVAKQYKFSGHPRWKLSELLTSRTVSVRCSEEFQVYSGRSEDEIEELYRSGASSWCSSSLSWDSWFVKGHRKCEVTISPFGETIVTVVPEDSAIKQKRLDCSYSERSEFSIQLLAAGLAGLVLFYTAPHLATSVTFRVSVGGTVSVFLITVILVMFAFRRMKPNNTLLSLAAGLSTLGVSATGLLKFWFRFPDTPSLLTNRWFLAYALFSFLVGAAVWYYFDNANGKIIDILAVGLRLLGLGMVFYSCSQVWELGSVIVALMVVTVLSRQRSTKAEAPLPTSPATGDLPLRSMSPRALYQTEFTPPLHTDTTPPDPMPGAWRTHPGILHYGDPGRQVEAHSHFSPRHPRTGPQLHAMNSAISAPVNTPTQDSPLLADGFVKNSLTGRLIKVHGGTYQSLVSKGFTLDRQSGSMLPPSHSPETKGNDVLTADYSSARRRPSRQSSRRRGINGTPVRGSGNSSVTSPY